MVTFSNLYKSNNNNEQHENQPHKDNAQKRRNQPAAREGEHCLTRYMYWRMRPFNMAHSSIKNPNNL
jgi:hypothetical protein